MAHVDVEAALGRRRVRAEVAREEEGAGVRGALVRLQHRAVRRHERTLAVEARVLAGVPPPVVVVLPLQGGRQQFRENSTDRLGKPVTFEWVSKSQPTPSHS